MGYSIFTLCSENYLDAYHFSIDSWLETKADKITIYTDFDLERKSERIEVLKYFEPSDDWLVNVGRKVTAAQHYLRNCRGKTDRLLGHRLLCRRRL